MVSNTPLSVKLANLKDLPEGKSLIVKAPDGKEIALFNVKGTIFALNNHCPHMGGPLGEGGLEGKMVTCPWHGWQFDVTNGTCENMPGENVSCFQIEVVNGEILYRSP
jgi:nitrite reductase/ring-hydroxylating ferredoxin subunit